VTKIVIGSLW